MQNSSLKKRQIFLLLFSFTSLIVTCSPLTSYFSNEGYVIEKTTGQPIAGANVILSWYLHVACDQTDYRGHYSIDLDISPDTGHVAVLTISKTGFHTETELISSRVNRMIDTVYLVPETDAAKRR
jgi:hypothetical protein